MARDIRLNYGYVIDSCRRAVLSSARAATAAASSTSPRSRRNRGAATYAVYAGAKAATTNFSRALAVELAARGSG